MTLGVSKRTLIPNMHVYTTLLAVVVPFLAYASASIPPDYVSPSGVEIFNPSNFFDATGPWSMMSRAGDTLYIAGMVLLILLPISSPAILTTFVLGMRGIYPENSTLAPTGQPRVQQAFNNMASLAKMAGYGIDSCVRGKEIPDPSFASTFKSHTELKTPEVLLLRWGEFKRDT